MRTDFKNLMPFLVCLTLITFNGCKTKTEPAAILTLMSACKNSQGKTLEERSKEILGHEMYTKSNTCEEFSNALDQMDDVRSDWMLTITNEFYNDPAYIDCVKPYAKKFESLNPELANEDGLRLFDSMNKQKQFALYKLLPVLLVYCD